jgi:cell wall-associated NlpC family hydrolase
MIKNRILLVLLMLWSGIGAFADNKDLKTANRIIESVNKKYAPDKRTAVFNLISSENSGQIILKGKTNLPEAKRLVLDSLSLLKINYRDSVNILPEKSLGEKTWAIVTLSVANLRSGPDHPAEMVTQALMGTPVKVLEKENSWYLIQTPDQYIGWVDGAGIALKTEAEMAVWKRSKRFIFYQTTGYAVAAPNKDAPHISDLVLGDLFEMVSNAKKYFQVKFPDGRTAFVKKTDCLSFQEWTNRKPTVQAIISVAKQLMGVPYLWGGTSCKAVDCSGMTKTAYFSQGIILTRDASQQARYGQHLDFKNLPSLKPGDLLFFGRSAQRVTHVGLYLGNDKYINAAGLVEINNINPQSPDFDVDTDRKDFVAAGRVLNSLNTEGIVLVRDHPWYSLPQTPSTKGGLKNSLP